MLTPAVSQPWYVCFVRCPAGAACGLGAAEHLQVATYGYCNNCISMCMRLHMDIVSSACARRTRTTASVEHVRREPGWAIASEGARTEIASRLIGSAPLLAQLVNIYLTSCIQYPVP